MRYPSRDDTALRIADTVVRYKGKFCFVALSDIGNIVNLRYLTPGGVAGRVEAIQIDPNDPELDVSVPTLGFANFGCSAGFVVRPPYRRQKQGLCRSVLNCAYPTDDKAPHWREIPCHVYSPDFAKMLLDNYPDVTDCLFYTRQYNFDMSRAFSKNFAIYCRGDKEKTLFYQTDEVGVFTKDSKPTVVLDPVWAMNSVMVAELESFGVVVKNA